MYVGFYRNLWANPTIFCYEKTCNTTKRLWYFSDLSTFWATFLQTPLATLLGINFLPNCEISPSPHTLFNNFALHPGLPDYSWYMIPKQEKMYQMNTKRTKWSYNIPNALKMSQIAIKYINIFPSKALQNSPNLEFWVWKDSSGNPASNKRFLVSIDFLQCSQFVEHDAQAGAQRDHVSAAAHRPSAERHLLPGLVTL
jgi:hypothetical protein